MEQADLLRAKARDYELLAISLADAAAVEPANGRSAVGFCVVAIVLLEIADALDEAA